MTRRHLPALAIALWLALPAAAQSLTNGGFEDSPDFNSWIVEPAFSGSLLVCDTNAAAARSGVRSAHFGAHEGQPDILTKYIATVPGQTYRISFWLASDNIAPVYDGFVVTFGTQVLLDLSNPQSGFAYTLYSFNAVAASESTPLSFSGYKRFGTFRLDDVSAGLAQATDQCADAPMILANYTYSGNNSTATNDANPTCGFSHSRDVWYRFIAPCNNTLTLDTCGSAFDTTLSVWTGSCGALTQVDCNDDNNGNGPCPGGTTSYLSIPVTAGTVYYIRIAGYGSGNIGNFNLRITLPLPQNDRCASAQELLSGDIVTGDLTCASTDGSATCASSWNDLWYSYTPGCDQTLHLDTCGTMFDTVLTVYTGACGDLTQVGCNDDAGVGCSFSTASRLELPVEGGERYLIRVARYITSSGGSFTLSAYSVEPLHATCATAQTIEEGSNSFEADCSQGSGGQICETPSNNAGAWFAYTATCSGPVFLDFCDAFDTDSAQLSVYTGECGALVCIASAEIVPTLDCPAAAEALSFNATVGVTYRICYTQPAGATLSPGILTIRLNRPANDDCDDAITITDGTYEGNTACATPDGTTTCGSSDESNSLWYTWTASCDGTLTLDTCGSDFDTVLAVYRGGCGAFEELACRDDDDAVCPPALRVSRVSLSVVAGGVYTIRVAGYSFYSGSFVLNVQGSVAEYFSCANAAPMDGPVIEIDGSCASGTEGRFCDTPINGPAMWYEYVAACSGRKTVEFCRTGGPPRGLFSVYGGDCNTPTCLASRNVASLPQFCPSGVTVFSFDAVAGETYRLCYTQFAGTPLGKGTLIIADEPPTNDNCANATALQLGANTGSAACATPDGQTICYLIPGDVWFRYAAPVDGRLVLDSCGTSFAAAFEILNDACSAYASNCSSNFPVGTCTDPGAAYLEFDVTAGREYYVRFGGLDGASGDYVINAALASRNDACNFADPAVSGGAYSGDLSFATADGAASCSPRVSDRDVWYRWEPASCSRRLILDTCGSAIDTVLTVYTGDCGTLSEVACNNDNGGQGPCPAQGDRAYLDIAITPGRSYWIRVAGANGAAGPFTLHVNEAAQNDSCAAAGVATGGTSAFDGGCGAADSSGAASSCGTAGQSAVWFRYVATCSSMVTVDLCGSDYDTVLSVFSGSCGNLTEVGCNDNAEGPACAQNGLNSRVDFAASSGQEYLIRISSNEAAPGLGQLRIDCLITCPADLNRDGVVDLSDLAILLSHFGMGSGAVHADGDVTGNGGVDIADLAILLSAFGTYCT